MYGKFFSDSYEVVVSSVGVIGKVGGVIGIIGIVIMVLLPIIKLIIIVLCYNILSGLVVPFVEDSKISDILKNFANIYKVMLGVLVGISMLFIFSIGMMLNMLGGIV